ncbi:HdeD family acid-resistance protein [Flammeovirga pectinis]|uniref:HdeD family acid-resistance protein n=1 Tax=Flammeovirga pectinis TaxID=2494373 RepID=A0A3S9P739_9BACT|nr:DUF308 domain-containing protein [Flammeovirga pectinis]AZQ64020.1 HdeD family acid-resistance protein [Flammeovirga pectinis]
MNNLFGEIKFDIKHWYLPLISGLLFVGLGIWSAMHPLVTLVSLSYIFSITFLMVGTLQVIMAIVNRKNMIGWGWSLVGGIFTAVLGAILIANPALSITTLPLYLGFYVMLQGFNSIGKAIEYKDHSSNWGWILFSGIVGVLLGFSLLSNIALAGMTTAFIASFALINTGVSEIIVSVKLKKLKKESASKN